MKKMFKKTWMLCIVMAMLLGMATTSLATDAKTVLPYDDLEFFDKEQLFVVRKGDQFGVIKPDGTVLVPLGTYGFIGEYSEGIATFAQNGQWDDDADQYFEGLWGYIDTIGQIVVPAKYNSVSPFAEDHAVAAILDNGVEIIDKSGAVKGKVGDASWGYDEEYRFSEGLCVLPMGDYENPSFIAVDTAGKTVVTFAQGYVDFENGFHDGLVAVGEGLTELGMGGYYYLNRDFYSEQYGYADRTGKTVIAAEYDQAFAFSSGMAGVSQYRDGQPFYGFIDKSGKVIVDIAYNNFRHGVDGIAQVFTEEGRFYAANTGKKIIDTVFDTVWDFSEGYGVVELDEKLMVIDKAGKTVLTAPYTPMRAYTNGYMNVMDSSGKIGSIDLRGNVVVPFIFDAAFAPVGGHIIGRIDGVFYTMPVTGASAPQPAQAKPTASNVLVNGTQTAFDAYNIDGSNFFKLRDLAYVLNGSEKSFQVKWDSASSTILLTSGTAYTPDGSEMKGKGGEAAYTPTSAKVLLDGNEVALTAYNIGGNNYFKLRDLGQAFDFKVDWNPATSTVIIDTTQPSGK